MHQKFSITHNRNWAIRRRSVKMRAEDFLLIYRSHLHAAGKRYQTLSTTISTGITIYSRPAIVCVHFYGYCHRHCSFFFPGGLSLSPYVQRWITRLYTVIPSFNGVFLFLFFLSLNKGEGLLIIVNDFTIKRWKHKRGYFSNDEINEF